VIHAKYLFVKFNHIIPHDSFSEFTQFYHDNHFVDLALLLCLEGKQMQGIKFCVHAYIGILYDAFDGMFGGWFDIDGLYIGPDVFDQFKI
jgi:hypothetical protein